jgi:hypothetical protein
MTKDIKGELRETIARAWCSEENSSKEMDVELINEIILLLLSQYHIVRREQSK